MAYLLRLWRVRVEGKQVWRASLETPGTGERRGFAGLKALLRFLEAETGETILDSEKGPESVG